MSVQGRFETLTSVTLVVGTRSSGLSSIQDKRKAELHQGINFLADPRVVDGRPDISGH
jgi:hypothetical protein